MIPPLLPGQKHSDFRIYEYLLKGTCVLCFVIASPILITLIPFVFIGWVVSKVETWWDNRNE